MQLGKRHLKDKEFMGGMKIVDFRGRAEIVGWCFGGGLVNFEGIAMNAEGESSNSAAWVVGVVVALILYVLSPGPLMMLGIKGVIPVDGVTEKILSAAMKPLSATVFQWEPAREFYEWWIGVWLTL